MSKIRIPKMKTIKEASKIVGLAEYYIRQLVKQNKVKFVMAGKKYLINMENLINYLNNGENLTNDEEAITSSTIRKVGA